MSWLTAPQALQLLAVRPQTLYANVSRKRIRAKPDPRDSRRSLYLEADVRRIARQHGRQRKAAAVAAGTLEWGDPILSSALSTVVDGRLYYRGHDAVLLSDRSTFEEVARLLWGTQPGEQRSSMPAAATKAPPTAGAGGPLQRAFLELGMRAGSDPASHGRAAAVLQAEAASVLDTLAQALVEPRAGSRKRKGDVRGLHARVAGGWRRPEVADLARRALILLADHELNASTFATRVAVSTGAPLAAGVLSGLATLTGPLHGRASQGVLELVAGVERAGAAATVREWLRQGRPIAGFGHPLYPSGDLRAAVLLQRFALPAAYAQLRDVVEEVIGEQPNVDFALAALTKVFGLPREAPLVLFALGRCAGWLAHALEQVATGLPIRPRARYTGPPIVQAPA